MSNNITSWKTKRIINFSIPLEAVQELPYAEIELLQNNKVSISGISEGFELEGTLHNGEILVSKISHYGEGSGHTWDDLLQALEQSKGSLVAVQIWEGGDITRLTVKDGLVDEEDIDL